MAIRILIKWHVEFSVHAEARERARKQLDPLEGFGGALGNPGHFTDHPRVPKASCPFYVYFQIDQRAEKVGSNSGSQRKRARIWVRQVLDRPLWQVFPAPGHQSH
jgi:hypothetical protein